MKESAERDLAVADALGGMADARIKLLEAERDKWKRRALAFQEGYKDKAFEVTALEIQKMDLLAHGADKVVIRQNESLKTKLLAACIERNEARDEIKGLRTVAEAARDFVHEPENWEAYQDSKGSKSVAWPPEFLLLAQAVEERYGPMPIDDERVSNQEGLMSTSSDKQDPVLTDSQKEAKQQ